VRADNAAVANFGSIENRGPHADENFTPNFAGMKDRPMADCDKFAGLDAVIIVQMDHAVVLDIAAGADLNALDVAAQNGVVPDGHVFVERDVPDNLRSVRHENRFMEPGTGFQVMRKPLSQSHKMERW
jgi:hypothetical protein